MRRTILAGNWKMNTDLASARELARQLRAAVGDVADRDIVLIPPSPFIEAVVREVAGSRIGVGAQECRAEAKGAFTGDVSVPMIASTSVATTEMI